MSNIFTAFKEHKDFDRNTPWTVIPSAFGNEYSVAPHYAETIELLLADGAEGEMRIGGRLYKLSGKQVFFIAPETVHSMHYLKSGGKLLNIKLSPDGFLKILNLREMLLAKGTDFDSIAPCQDTYDALFPLAEKLAAPCDIFGALEAVVGIFSVLCASSERDENSERVSRSALNNSEMREIIRFTSEHFAEKITVETIAEKSGYSKFYFCEKFRSASGITYHSYLTGVRISNACKLLSSGASVSEAAEKSGFCDPSYFIRCFKKIKGITPKQYVETIK